MNNNIDERVENFFSSYPQETYQKTELIIFPGTNVDQIHYLESGPVGQYAVSTSGNKIILNIYKAGTFFPLTSLFAPEANSYFFEALQPSIIRKAPIEVVDRFIQDEPAVMYSLMRRVYIGMGGLLKRLVAMHSATASQRIAMELYLYALRFSDVDQDTCTLNLTHAQIAELCGLSRETTSRQLTVLERRKLIKRGHKSIDIASIKALGDSVSRNR